MRVHSAPSMDVWNPTLRLRVEIKQNTIVSNVDIKYYRSCDDKQTRVGFDATNMLIDREQQTYLFKKKKKLLSRNLSA